MATITLRAQMLQPKMPDSFGDNSIIISNIMSLLNEPPNNGTASHWNQYILGWNDFTTDTFPQFEDRSGLHSIKITDIQLPSSVSLSYINGELYWDDFTGKYQYNYEPVGVGFRMTSDQLQSKEALVLTTPRVAEPNQVGYFEYINSVDGNYNQNAASRIYVTTFPTPSSPDLVEVKFKTTVNIEIPNNSNVVLTEDMFTKLFEHDDNIVPDVNINNAVTIAQMTALFRSYKNKPYKIHIVSNPNNSIKLRNKVVEIGQKVTLSDIKSKVLTVDSGNINSVIIFEFMFGNGYIGCFRLTPKS